MRWYVCTVRHRTLSFVIGRIGDIKSGWGLKISEVKMIWGRS